MGMEQFDLKPTKAEKRDSAELMRDIEAAREFKEQLDDLQNTDIVGKKALEDLENIVADYKESIVGLTPEQIQSNNLDSIPGVVR